MVKEVYYTKITPLPSNVPRLLALDLLHSHDEFIKLNPLVTGVKPIEAPRTADADEYFSHWYTISEVIRWGPGLKKKIAFNGVFHNQPWGLQSHVMAPMGVEFRNKYRIGGNQPGEPREARELGLNTPADGLYLREDISFTCQMPLTSGYVKKEMQAASQVMIDRMTRKAELLDEGKLHAMFEDGMLKTAKPSYAATFEDRAFPSPSTDSSPATPSMPNGEFPKPDTMSTQVGYTRYNHLAGRNDQQNTYEGTFQQGGYQVQDYAKYSSPQQFVSELPASNYSPPQPHNIYLQPSKPQQAFRAELVGDTSLRPPSPQANEQAHSEPTPAGYQAYTRSPQPSPNLLSPPSSAPPTRTSFGNNSLSTDREQTNRHSLAASSAAYHIHDPSRERERPSSNRGDSNRSGLSDTSTNSASAYHVTNPEPPTPAIPPPRSPKRASPSQTASSEWQKSLVADRPINEDYYRNSRHSHGAQQQQSPSSSPLEPDHQRLSKVSLRAPNDAQRGAGAAQPSAQGQVQISPCPVCGLFEGDEAAVSHHVSKAHFPHAM